MLDYVHDPLRPVSGMPGRINSMAAKKASRRRTPRRMGCGADTLAFTQIDIVQSGRVEPFPPFSLIIGEGQVSIIRNAGELALSVTIECGLPPPPRVIVTECHAVSEASYPGRSSPFADQIIL